MKRVRRYSLALWAGFCIFSGSASMAQAQENLPGAVEIFVQGRKYNSIKDYRREQIKDVLLKTLSSRNLKEFSEDEICEILKEVRKQQTSDNSLTKKQESGELLQEQRVVEEGARDLSAPQMQEMLKEYLDKHKDTQPLFIDPEKVKSVIIEPEE